MGAGSGGGAPSSSGGSVGPFASSLSPSIMAHLYGSGASNLGSTLGSYGQPTSTQWNMGNTNQISQLAQMGYGGNSPYYGGYGGQSQQNYSMPAGLGK